METYHTRAELGSDSGPYYPKRPDRIFKRAIRGMLPYKTEDGREALSNVRVYVGTPTSATGRRDRRSRRHLARPPLEHQIHDARGHLRVSGSQRHMVTNTSGKKKTAVARATVRARRRGPRSHQLPASRAGRTGAGATQDAGAVPHRGRRAPAQTSTSRSTSGAAASAARPTRRGPPSRAVSSSTSATPSCATRT